MWTRHFVKYGDSTEEAWRQWKGMYHLSMTMCYASFIAATWKMYSIPSDWAYGLVLLRHVLGAGLVSLQLWTAISIYESLGEFGCGIYRYLNNPERIIGLAGIWGAVFITGSRAIFFLALLSHTLTFAFLQFVEKPHMQKLYGRNLRSEAGLSKSIKRSLPPQIKKWHGNVDRVLEETGHFVEEFLDAARPKFAAGVFTIFRDTSAIFSQYPARLTLTRIAPDLAGYDPRDYSVSIEGASSDSAIHHRLYMVADNASREVTRVSSTGRWVATVPNEYESTPADKDGSTQDYVEGEMLFEGDKLFWSQGVFEFRYHHDGKHNVMAISLPFEIRIPRFDDENSNLDVSLDSANTLSQSLIRSAVEQALLPVVRNCFDRDPDIAPNTVDESFGGADGNVRNLAWRICNAKQVLAPYSMSHSKGTNTPNSGEGKV
ncbi:hypothetical protein DID88_005388 [Monilinia fructigena]|uniref:Uncharacterized protein n=1 Tax=Monilinia fructigena TaxID=38457 RepID=A0A395IZP9_9HELO|nr:hypothetical protein DID88_005388 [Monilinia fructigena]